MFAEEETSQSVCHLSQNNVKKSKVFICKGCRIWHGGGGLLIEQKLFDDELNLYKREWPPGS